jgi:ornithine cyclodeaminase/alanine dehydrogenase-like protein (mu-crystallin family)
VVFGAGPQAHAHVAALAAVRPLTHVTVVARRADARQPWSRTADDPRPRVQGRVLVRRFG